MLEEFTKMEAERARKDALWDYLLIGGFSFMFTFAVVSFIYHQFILKQNIVGAFVSQIKHLSVIMTTLSGVWSWMPIFFFGLLLLIFLLEVLPLIYSAIKKVIK